MSTADENAEWVKQGMLELEDLAKKVDKLRDTERNTRRTLSELENRAEKLRSELHGVLSAYGIYPAPGQPDA